MLVTVPYHLLHFILVRNSTQHLVVSLCKDRFYFTQECFLCYMIKPGRVEEEISYRIFKVLGTSLVTLQDSNFSVKFQDSRFLYQLLVYLMVVYSIFF